MDGIIVYSDIYKYAPIFCWKKGCLKILRISYEHDGISIDQIIKNLIEKGYNIRILPFKEISIIKFGLDEGTA